MDQGPHRLDCALGGAMQLLLGRKSGLSRPRMRHHQMYHLAQIAPPTPYTCSTATQRSITIASGMARWVEVPRTLAHPSETLQRPCRCRNRKPFRAPLQPRAPAGRTPLADRTTLSHSSQGHETQTNSPRLDTGSLPTTPRPSTRCRPAPSPSPGRWCPQVEPSKTWKIRKFAQ